MDMGNPFCILGHKIFGYLHVVGNNLHINNKMPGDRGCNVLSADRIQYTGRELEKKRVKNEPNEDK